MTIDQTLAQATRPDRFPAQPEELTPLWLTSALHSAGALPMADSVVELSTDCLSAGVGMMGMVSRIHLTYSRPGAGPASLIMKSASSSTTNRDVAQHFRLYEREVRFYQGLGPDLEPVVPHAVFAGFTPQSVDYAIVMDDLRDYQPGDQVAGASIEQARLAVVALAGFHAAWWGRTEDPLVDWVPSTNAPLIQDSMIEACRGGWDTMAATFAGQLPEQMLAHRDAYLDALPALYDAMSSGQQTLAHTDYRVDNLMFGTAPEHEPIVIVDWSAVAKSKGVQDLAYFLTQNLSDECRRGWTAELIDLYHRTLVDHGVVGYSREEFDRDYDIATLFNFVYAIVIGSALDLGNDRAVAFVGKLVERSADSIVSRGLLPLLATL